MSLPYMPFYVKDYEAKTAWLTLAQDGAYNRLLRLCWMTPGCSVPNDPEWIAQRLRVSPSDYETVVKPVIDAFFKVSRGRVFNPKQREVFRDAKAVSKKRSSAGVRGALKRKALKNNEKDLSRAKAGLKQPKPKPNNTNNTLSHTDRSVCGDGSDRERDLEFERVWEIYPCTVATSRKRAEAAWRELTPERRLLAVAEAERLASIGEPQTLYPADFLEGITERAETPASPDRPQCGVAAEVYDAMLDIGQIGPWIAWLSPQRVTYEGRTVHPPTPFMQKELRARYGDLFRRLNLTLGSIKPLPECRKDKAA